MVVMLVLVVVTIVAKAEVGDGFLVLILRCIENSRNTVLSKILDIFSG